jgi:precorrin-8X/cobalt-precorrin-8 methylmutase
MAKYMNDPMGIENKSFEIIESELSAFGEYNFDDRQMKVVKRVIHTTADFDYANEINFKGDAIDKAIKAINSGCKIYTDTNMISAGVNKRKLAQFGCELVNFVAHDDVRALASKRGVTRSTVSMEKACKDSAIKIFAIGNAPTALFTLMALIEKGMANPSLIIGVPVGFVGADTSKAELLNQNVASISIQGRKGGSTVAVAILNALFYILDNER